MPHFGRLAISTASNILAVYTSGIPEPRFGDLVSAVSADGWAIWSRNRVTGGPPYFEAAIDPNQVREALDRLEHDGLFTNLPIINYGIPGSLCLNICIRNGAKAFDVLSAHELFEASGEGVAESLGVRGLRNRSGRLQILSEQPSEWLFSRMVWLELRGLIDQLVPREGTPVTGCLEFVTASEVSWTYRSLPAER